MNGPFRKNAYVPPPTEPPYAKQMHKIAVQATSKALRIAEESTIKNYGIARDLILSLARKGLKAVTILEIAKAFSDKEVHCRIPTLIGLLEKDGFVVEIQKVAYGKATEEKVAHWQYQ